MFLQKIVKFIHLEFKELFDRLGWCKSFLNCYKFLDFFLQKVLENSRWYIERRLGYTFIISNLHSRVEWTLIELNLSSFSHGQVRSCVIYNYRHGYKLVNPTERNVISSYQIININHSLLIMQATRVLDKCL